MATDEDLPKAICVGCGKHPDELPEYSPAMTGEEDRLGAAEDYVWREEGTLNLDNGHFLCTECYIKAGQPSGPRGWVAP